MGAANKYVVQAPIIRGSNYMGKGAVTMVETP